LKDWENGARREGDEAKVGFYGGTESGGCGGGNPGNRRGRNPEPTWRRIIGGGDPFLMKVRKTLVREGAVEER